LNKIRNNFYCCSFVLVVFVITISLFPTTLQNAVAVGCTNWAGLPDTDCDGLADAWEDAGYYDPNGDGRRVLLTGADSHHKDLFVEIDYMTAMAPIPAAITDVVNAFAGGNVWNPDGTGGVRLHVLVDSSTPITDTPCTSIWGDFNTIAESHMGTAAERAANPSQYQEQKNVKFYGIFIREQCGAIGSSGNSENPGDNFVVSLGSFPATTKIQESTLMHELGHDLGLNHGGSAATPSCKPNFLSVMSIGMQFADDVPARRLDYSRSIISAMPLTSLNEPGAIGASVPSWQPTAIGHTNPPAGINRTHAYFAGSTNLNYNWYTGDLDPPYESGLSSAMQNWGRTGCWDNSLTSPLYGYWDWAGLRFWTWSNNKYVNVALPSVDYLSTDTQSSKADSAFPTVNNSQSLDGKEGINQSIACNPLDQSCKLNPCDPDDKQCTFEKRINFTEPINANYDYGNRTNSHTDQTIGDIKAVHLSNLLAFNNKIQSLPEKAFNSTANATAIKHDFDVKIRTGEDNLSILLNSSKFDIVVSKLEEIKGSLPKLILEPYLNTILIDLNYLMAGLQNMLPENPQPISSK
jgi:Metallo-peptidase family M12B Reprolysin-like